MSSLFSFINRELTDLGLLVDSATVEGVSKYFTFLLQLTVEQFGSPHNFAQGYTYLTPSNHLYPNEAFVPLVVDFINFPREFKEMITSYSMPPS